jgi:biopolymer transport protein ExbD
MCTDRRNHSKQTSYGNFPLTCLNEKLPMTEFNASLNERSKTGTRRNKKHSPKTDMTPMVDLGFLLITFFVITMEMNKPATLALNMPVDGPPSDLGESDALTVLLDKDNTIYYYHGQWEAAMKKNEIYETNFSAKEGLRKVIQEKQRKLDVANAKEGRNALMLLIKPGEAAVYKNVIDMLDEALIGSIKKYTVLKPDNNEVKYLATRMGKFN